MIGFLKWKVGMLWNNYRRLTYAKLECTESGVAGDMEIARY